MNIEELKNAYNQYCKIYREEHKEKIKLSMKKWYQQNKDNPEYIEKRKASSKRYYETQRDLEGKSKRIPSKLSPEERIKKAEYNKRYYNKKKTIEQMKYELTKQKIEEIDI